MKDINRYERGGTRFLRNVLIMYQAIRRRISEEHNLHSPKLHAVRFYLRLMQVPVELTPLVTTRRR
jgi:hypothetical protein